MKSIPLSQADIGTTLGKFGWSPHLNLHIWRNCQCLKVLNWVISELVVTIDIVNALQEIFGGGSVFVTVLSLSNFGTIFLFPYNILHSINPF